MAAERVGLSVAGKIIELLFEPIQRELGYLLCFNNNIQDLETGLRDLKAAINDVQAREDAEERSRRTLGEGVKLWIEDANGKITEAENVMEEKAELQKGCFSIKWCPNLKLRFSLGRKGKKLSLVLNDLLQSGKDHLLFTGIDLPTPPINMSNYNGDASEFESRKKIVDQIIEMLMDKETRLIGICGMGGIGKTTLAKQVLQKVHDFHNNLFDFQVISTVSRPPNFNAIQQQVVEGLKGPSLKEIENEIERAERLRSAFVKKKVVVLLDDVWEEFDLNAKGFPLKESEYCCKIIYTSRTQKLWVGEGTIRKKEISLEELSSKESWNLFRRKANLHEDDNDFHSKNKIARKIVDECKGLPLALEVAGGALIEKSEHEWKDMLFKLQSEHEHDTEKVQKVLETSYGFLNDPIAKYIFLLCCLFPEDGLIPIETLYRYAMGLQLFKGTMNDVYHIRNRVYTLVDDLIRRNLLMNVQTVDSTVGPLVKMHDVVRDVGLSIAKQEEKDINFLICDHGVNQLQNYVMGPNTKIISILFFKSGLKVPDDVMEFRGSNLELLRLNNSLAFASDPKIPWNLIQGAEDLKILDIVRCGISEFLYSFPIPYLAKLKMLSLQHMNLSNISNLSFIQHLTCLETLNFRYSYNMRVLPNEIGELRNLKVLDLMGCSCIINNGILSRLTNLQELCMLNSFEDWKTLKEEDNISTIGEDNNAATLNELNCLDKLRRLELSVPYIEQVPKNVRLFSSSTLLNQFKISIGAGRRETRRIDQIKFESSERSVEVENVEDHINLFDAIGVLIQNGITSLYLRNDSNMWEQMYLNRHLSALKDIILENCGSIITLFVHLESSPHISRIEEINGFGHLLRRIEIYECNQMRHLCSTSIFRHLKKLKVLVLKKCERMEDVVSISKSKEEIEKIDFNILETLELCKMDYLTCFCRGINEIYFHRLKSLVLEGLKSFIFPTKIEIPQLKHMEIISIPSIITLCNIVAPSLQELKIDRCDNLKYISFSDSLMMENIFHLQNLTITQCKLLKGVIAIFSNTEEQRQISIKFSNLMKLELRCLAKLVSFVIHVNHLRDEVENEENPPNALFYCDEEQVSLPCLQELILCELSKINYIIGWKDRHRDIQEGYDKKILQSFFHNLKRLKLACFGELMSFVGFINTIGDDNSEKQNALFYLDDDEVSFSCLEKLKIEYLSKINYIVAWKGGRGRRHHHHNIEEEGCDRKIQPQFFPNLSHLRLSGLDELVSFALVKNNIDDKSEKQNALFYHDDQVSIPCLKLLEINKLPNINYIVGCKGRGEDNNDYDKTPFIFPILESLIVGALSNLIHMYESNHPELGVLLFQNVKYMSISGCEKLRYLFSENIGRVAAKHLMNIDIRSCPMMEVVMKNEENEELGAEEDDKAKAEREGIICHFFPLLMQLELRNLSGLRRFCDVAYTWTLPSLHYLRLSECPKLEALSPGYLNSPSLYFFKYDNSEEFVKNRWKGDVNAALCDIKIIEEKKRMEKEKEKEKKKREDGDGGGEGNEEKGRGDDDDDWW